MMLLKKNEINSAKHFRENISLKRKKKRLEKTDGQIYPGRKLSVF